MAFSWENEGRRTRHLSKHWDNAGDSIPLSIEILQNIENVNIISSAGLKWRLLSECMKQTSSVSFFEIYNCVKISTSELLWTYQWRIETTYVTPEPSPLSEAGVDGVAGVTGVEGEPGLENSWTSNSGVIFSSFKIKYMYEHKPCSKCAEFSIFEEYVLCHKIPAINTADVHFVYLSLMSLIFNGRKIISSTPCNRKSTTKNKRYRAVITHINAASWK